MNYKTFSFAHVWELYEENLLIEYQQCIDEGKDITELKPIIDNIYKMPRSKYKHKLGQQIFEMISALPQKDSYPFIEPSDYDSIKACRRKSKQL